MNRAAKRHDERTRPQPKARRTGLRKAPQRPDLSIPKILGWADAHFERHGRWPKVNSGHVFETADENWSGIDQALKHGYRGLPRDSELSLARLLEKHRQVRNRMNLPPLTLPRLLEWATTHHRRTGKWPMADSGAVHEAPEETWSAINASLHNGLRGLPRRNGQSLARLLESRRGVRKASLADPLKIERIRAWASAYRQREGRRPTARDGAILEAPQETWLAVDMALRAGRRGLPGSSSLYQFLQKYGLAE